MCLMRNHRTLIVYHHSKFSIWKLCKLRNYSSQKLTVQPLLYSGIVMLQITPTARQGGACAITAEKCCFYLNQTEQIVSNSHVLKENINTFQKRNEALQHFWADLFLGLGGQFNRVWGNVLQFALFCLFILILIYVHFSLCRSIMS